MRGIVLNYQLKTAVFMGGLVLILLALGQIVGGTTGVIYALIFAGIFNLILYWYSDKIALLAHGARPATEEEYPQLHRIVSELAMNAGVPRPKIYVIPNQSPNAFATGRDPAHSAVAVTAGILQILDEKELRGVLGHELSHVQHRDILVTTLASIIAAAIFMIARMLQWAFIWGFGDRDSRRESNPLALMAVVAMVILAPIAAVVLQSMISKNREFMADAGGAKLSHDPLSLASALRKLSTWSRRMPLATSPAFHSLYIVHAYFGNFGALFSTHPPIEARIQKLEEMARTFSYLTE